MDVNSGDMIWVRMGVGDGIREEVELFLSMKKQSLSFLILQLVPLLLPHDL